MADSQTSAIATMSVAASALRAQQARMRVIAENMANADSVSQTAGGDPYRRQVPVFSPTVLPSGGQGVAMSRVAKDQTPFKTEYRPGHPAADAKADRTKASDQAFADFCQLLLCSSEFVYVD